MHEVKLNRGNRFIFEFPFIAVCDIPATVLYLTGEVLEKWKYPYETGKGAVWLVGVALENSK